MTYLEIIDDGLAIQIVVDDSEEVPVQRLAPWITAFHFLFVLRFPFQREESSDFTIYQHLAHEHQKNHVGMAHEQETYSP